MVIHPLFHYSPTLRREAIRQHGLRVSSEPVVHTAAMPYICLSQSPSQAWVLSAGACGDPGQDWDCWQVTLALDDEVEVRPFFGNRIEELRIRNDIPHSRIWLVGSRSVPTSGQRH